MELVQRQTVMHYQAARARAFLRIVVATPNLVAQARGACATPSITRTLREVFTSFTGIRRGILKDFCCSEAGGLLRAMELVAQMRGARAGLIGTSQ